MPALTAASPEVEQLRFHLGYGNVSVGGYPYTPDGFFEIFSQVIAPNLTFGAETSATTAIAAGATVAVTPVAMTGIAAYARLVVDVGDDAETIVVAATGGATFTAHFLKAHAATGYPVAVESGVARLRLLLHSAARAWEKLQDASITKVAGLNSVGNGKVVWFQGNRVLADTLEHYQEIARRIGDLVRVRPRWEEDGSSGCSRLETY